jgi:stage II sporulation protein D (peptidoglycan lytic transglycosylase)
VKSWALFLVSLAIPSRSLAQDVQVRIYSAHPPTSLEVQAIEGHLHWKACPTCQEQTGESLSVESPNASPSTGPKGMQQEFLITGTYKLRPPNGPPFSSPYPLRIQSPSGGLIVVVTVPLEQYVQHVLMAESGNFQNAEALKAMAVAARSYANKFIGQHAKEGFDFCDTTHCQAFYWRNVTPQVRAAADATRRESLSYQDKPAAAFYNQNCGGTTAAASETWAEVSEPYLSIHQDPFCLTTGGLKWETTLTHAQIDRALRVSGLQSPENWQTLEISSRNNSGRVRTLNLFGGKPATFSLAGSSLRFAVNRVFGWNHIRSDLYDLRNAGGKVLFSGRGAGHGVGLCQAGAEEMARQGKTYKEILSFYYPGTQVTASEKETWQKRSDERFDLISTDPEVDSSILPVAERLLREAEDNVGWRVPFRIRLQVFSTLDNYRNTTGQPGWIAASTRGQTIRLQPLVDLRRRLILESTLRHELYHLLVETHAARNVPLWFREGLTLHLSSPAVPDAAPSPMAIDQIEQVLKHGGTRENTQSAYTSAQRIVAGLIQQHGKQAVLAWLSSALPADVLRSLGGTSAPAPHSGASQQPGEKPEQIGSQASQHEANSFPREG